MREQARLNMVGLGGLGFCSCFEGRISEDAIPDLEPVLLVSGMGGSILNSKPKKFGFQTRVWVRILLADFEFKKKLWSAYNPRSGHCVFLVYRSMAIADEKKVYARGTELKWERESEECLFRGRKTYLVFLLF